MAIALVNSTASFSASTSALNVTAGNLLVVFARNSVSNTQTLSISDTAGNTFTPIASASMSSADKCTLFYAKNCLGNASNIFTVSSDAGPGSIGLAVVQYSGLDTTNPLDTQQTGAVDTGSPATSVTTGAFTTTSPNEVIVAGWSVNATGSTFTAGSGYAIEVQDASQVTNIEDMIVSTTQSGITASASDASHGWEMVVATFVAAGGGGGIPASSTTQFLQLLGLGT